MSDELDTLKFVANRLDQAGIPYMLTGSFAVNLYATPRMTRDIDLVINIPSSRIDKFLFVFQDDFYITREDIQGAVSSHGMFNIIHNDTIIKIDLIIRKDTEYRLTEFERRQQVQIANALIWVVAPEDLIISKLLWAKDSFSEMQFKDIRNLISSLNNLDETYLSNWIEKLELSNVYKKVFL